MSIAGAPRDTEHTHTHTQRQALSLALITPLRSTNSKLSPVWGNAQELHTDAPHGPWAFVLSLTPRERAFAGGHTLVMQPRVLNYWPGFDPSTGLEMKHLVWTHLTHCLLRSSAVGMRLACVIYELHSSKIRREAAQIQSR